MKPIGDLNRIGGTYFRSLGIDAATIPSNHFYTRVPFQPSLQALDGTVRKQVNDLMFVQIDKNRSIALPFAPSPVIYADVSDWIAGRIFARSLNRTNDGVVAAWDRQPVQNTTAWQTTCCVADESYDLADSCRPARMGSRDLR